MLIKMATLEKTTLTSSNTNISANGVENRKGRNFHLVVWPKSEKYLNEFVNYVENLSCFQYILICHHNKEDNEGPVNPHKHIYLQLKECRVLSKKKVGTIHIETCFASAQANIDYIMGFDKKHNDLGVECTKLYENGTPLFKGGFHSIKDVKNASDEEVSQMDIKLINCIAKVRPPTKIKINEWHKKIKVYYLYGTVSGIGKTLSIYRTLINNKIDEFLEVKHSGNFWLGISGEAIEGCVIYDDFRDSDMKANEFINFIDYHVHNMDYKNGSAKNKANLIIITSIIPPENIYKHAKEETKKQWLRRMIKINLDKINYRIAEQDEQYNSDVDLDDIE